MSAPRRRTRTASPDRRARTARTKLDEITAAMLEQDCPYCGNRSLTIEDPTFRWGIIIYCERPFCRWKPPVYLK